MTAHLRRLLETALDTATPTLRDLATRTGVTYAAIRRYRLGDRTPAPAVFARLARMLRRQARHLLKLADALDATSKGES